MLIEGQRPIAEIAYVVGFSSQANFGRAFREAINVTPRQFRAQARAGWFVDD